jgi:integrase
MRTKKVDMTHITDRHIEGRVGGQRWRLRMRGVPGHKGVVSEMFDTLDEAILRRSELNRARGHAEDQPAQAVPVEAGSVSLTQIKASYLRTLDEVEPTAHYRETVAMVLDRAIAANLDDVRDPTWTEHCLAWLDGLTIAPDHPRAGEPASSATKRAYRAILGGALNHAVDEKEWLAKNPFLRIKKRRTKAEKLRRDAQRSITGAHKIIPVEMLARIVSDGSRFIVDAKRQEAEAMVAACKGDKVAAAAALKVNPGTVYNRLARPEQVEDPRWMIGVLLAYTGMRLGQAVHLEWRDVNMTERTIRLRPEIAGNRSGTDATVPMESELYEILASIVPSGDYVVPTPVEVDSKRQRTRAMSRAWLKDSFDGFLARCGAGDHTAHDFRHSFVCMLTAMGVQDLEIKRRVNHAQIEMTSRYADHLLTTYKRDCATWGCVLRLRSFIPPKRIEFQQKSEVVAGKAVGQ